MQKERRLSTQSDDGVRTERYGMIYVDRNSDGSGTLERYKKKSFDWYKEIIASNGGTLVK